MRFGVGVDEFSVDLPSIAGFALDLQDLVTNFSSNASTQLSRLVLPSGTTGLLATLTSALDGFHNALSGAHQRDVTTLNALVTDLSTAKSGYRATDEAYADSISAGTSDVTGDAGTSGRSGDPQGVTRYSGLQLPNLPHVEDGTYTIRRVVTAAIDLISAYDEPWSQVVGIKPAADYLSSLVSDWEALQAIGKRIGLLGINDYVTSQNISGGTTWLRRVWTGGAAQSFESRAGGLGRSVDERSNGVETVSKIVENGGALLERLVYNQAIGISGAITKPINALGFTMPLGVWALRINDPMNETLRSQITSAVDSLKQTAESMKNAITTTVGRISQALNYFPGQAGPNYNATDFDIPAKVVVDMGSVKYGFGNNVWWGHSIESSASST
ncbi:hypothetical protein ACQP2U_12925 [Nocardia sp. CA-084685]|uniref:hypothetical protein n=1 Tax=Nocardia sp. CA-084685 TaxID=3239970 RepID=UPI003D9810B4